MSAVSSLLTFVSPVAIVIRYRYWSDGGDLPATRRRTAVDGQDCDLG